MKRPQYVFRPNLNDPQHRRAWALLQQVPPAKRKEFLVQSILGAAPFAACGFFTYHGMTAEQVLWAWFKSEILCPKRLVFKSDSYYYEAMQPAIRAGIKRKRGKPMKKNTHDSEETA